jgi:hypothetical protein
MARSREAIKLAMKDEQIGKLGAIARSQSETGEAGLVGRSPRMSYLAPPRRRGAKASIALKNSKTVCLHILASMSWHLRQQPDE